MDRKRDRKINISLNGNFFVDKAFVDYENIADVFKEIFIVRYCRKMISSGKSNHLNSRLNRAGSWGFTFIQNFNSQFFTAFMYQILLNAP